MKHAKLSNLYHADPDLNPDFSSADRLNFKLSNSDQGSTKALYQGSGIINST